MSGQRSVAIHQNAGVVQTGDYARALTGTSALGSPQAVDPPPAGLLNLPKPAVRTFVGRDAQLDELDRLVRAGSGVVAQTVHGLGGVGKSELALQYATRHRMRYRVTWWVLAESPDTIEAGLARLAFRLHPDVQVIGTQAEAAGWALGWLQGHSGWLLILDNVERRLDVEPLLGQLTTGHVLITTRRDVGWDDITDGCLRLDVLDPDAAVALLTRISEQTDTGTAGVLAGELGCLPLALQQAGAYLRQTRTPMADYLQRLREDPANVLAAVAFDDDARRTVARTWSVTVGRIAEHAPLAAALLQILSCFAPDALPRDVVTGVAGAADVEAALGTLASYNMINLSDETVTVHRLVQVVTISQLRQPASNALPPDDEGGRREPTTLDGWDDMVRLAVEMLRTSMPSGDPDIVVTSWPRWAALTPHVAALERLCTNEIGGIPLAGMLGQTALFDKAQGRYRQALAYEERALAIVETTRGPDHGDVATILNNLAATLLRLGRAIGAEQLQRRALAITEAELGPDHIDVAGQLSNLASSVRDLGRAADAEQLQRRALAITEAELGPDHLEVAKRLDNLAGSLRDLGRQAEAEQLYRRALAITESVLDPDHPRVAMALNNLAASLRDLHRAADAEPLQRRALAIAEATLGPDHPDIAAALDNLALNMRALDRAAEAEPLHRRAVSIIETALGPDHPDRAIYLNSLAGSLRELGREAEAEPLYRRALAITEAVLGPDHYRLATMLEGLADSLRELGREAEAEPLYRRALAVTEARLGPDHLYVAVRMGNLVASLRALDRPAEAEPLRRRAMEILRRQARSSDAPTNQNQPDSWLS